MNWQFWAVFWVWVASIVILIVGGLFLLGPIGRVMIGLGIVDLVAFVIALLWLASALNSDV